MPWCQVVTLLVVVVAPFGCEAIRGRQLLIILIRSQIRSLPLAFLGVIPWCQVVTLLVVVVVFFGPKR